MRERDVEKFFAYARAREKIRLDREAGKPRPWSSDPIFQRNRFCNVSREDDKVTRWFRENVRGRLDARARVSDDGSKLLLATVVFRMFNRIESGEAIFCDDDLLGGHSAFDSFYETGSTSKMRGALTRRQGRGPFVTGSYIISTPPGMSKLSGVLWILKKFYDRDDWRTWFGDRFLDHHTLESTHEFLRGHPYLGPFHSYEIVTDLAETCLLENAPDIMTWASPGPGARRGLRRIRGSLAARVDRRDMLPQMRELLLRSREHRMWPWPIRLPWNMRTVEHTLCEFDKYERVRLRQGRVKGKGDYA